MNNWAVAGFMALSQLLNAWTCTQREAGEVAKPPVFNSQVFQNSGNQGCAWIPGTSVRDKERPHTHKQYDKQYETQTCIYIYIVLGGKVGVLFLHVCRFLQNELCPEGNSRQREFSPAAVAFLKGHVLMTSGRDARPSGTSNVNVHRTDVNILLWKSRPTDFRRF